MSLIEENKKIRKQVKALRTENLALSSIYWHLLQLLPEEQKKELSKTLQRKIFEHFNEKEIVSFYGRHSDRVFSSTLETEILQLIKPNIRGFAEKH